MAKKIFEIVGGRIERGSGLPPIPPIDLDHFDPLFDALEEYITRIRFHGQEVIIIDRIPPEVLIALSPANQRLYGELLDLAHSGTSPVVHLEGCPMIITRP